MCFARGCERKGKSIRRERIEGAFVELLNRLTPGPRLFEITRAMFRDAWEQRSAQALGAAQAYDRELAKTDKQIATLLDRVVEALSPSIIAAYEKRIAELERTKLLLAEKRASVNPQQGAFDELFELAMRFLASPSKLWDLGKLEYRKLVLRLTFADRLVYGRPRDFEPW